MKYIAITFTALLFMASVCFAGPGGLTIDRWGNIVQSFAPYSTTAKIFTGGTLSAARTSAIITWSDAILGFKVNCTEACSMYINNQSGISFFPILADTDYTVIKNNGVTRVVFTQASSATINNCKFQFH